MTGPVRPARPADRPRLRAIQTVVLAEPWPELLELAVDGPPRSDGPSFSDGPARSDGSPLTDGPALCLVHADPDPTGYALCVVDGSGETAYLAELAVADGHRGEGRGSTLLDSLVDRLRERGVTRLRATVRTVDERARSFYVAREFEKRDRLADHYDDCDGLLLTRDL